jgi:hypothetical protein
MVHPGAPSAYTEKEIIAKVSEKHGVPRKALTIALTHMIEEGYLCKNEPEKGKKHKKKREPRTQTHELASTLILSFLFSA